MKTLIALVSLSLFPILPSTATDPDCTGCVGSYAAPVTTSPCISITEDNPGSASTGTCNPTTCKQLTGCVLQGSFTITNTGAGGCPTRVYVRTRVNGGCSPGTTAVGSGDSIEIKLDGDELMCGTDYQIKVYVNANPADCSNLAEGSINYLCTSCYRPHGG